MKLASLRALPVHAQLLLWRFGLAFPLAIVAALLASGLHFQAQARAHAQAQRTAELRKPAARDHTAAPEPDGQAGTAQSAAQSLSKRFPPANEALQQLQQLASLATREHLVIDRSDYAQQQDSVTGLSRLQLSQPVHGPYASLRTYLQAVLDSAPNISLDHASFRRDNVGKADVEAQLRWSLWFASVAVAPAKPASATASSPSASEGAAFEARSWTPAPTAPAPASVSDLPQAPALPFAVLGMQETQSGVEVFLGRGDQVFLARPGAVLGSDYRVETIEGKVLTLTYLPLGQRQSMGFGGQP